MNDTLTKRAGSVPSDSAREVLSSKENSGVAIVRPGGTHRRKRKIMARKTVENSGETVVSQNVRIRVQYSDPANPEAGSLIVDNSENNGQIRFIVAVPGGVSSDPLALNNDTALRLATTLRRMARG